MSIPVKYYFCVYTTLSSGPTLLESCLLLTGGSLHCLRLGKSYTATFKQVAYFSSIQANSKLAQAICQYIFCKLTQAICQFVFADQLGLSVTIFILDWLGQSVSIFLQISSGYLVIYLLQISWEILLLQLSQISSNNL